MRARRYRTLQIAAREKTSFPGELARNCSSRNRRSAADRSRYRKPRCSSEEKPNCRTSAQAVAGRWGNCRAYSEKSYRMWHPAPPGFRCKNCRGWNRANPRKKIPAQFGLAADIGNQDATAAYRACGLWGLRKIGWGYWGPSETLPE